MRPHSHIRFSLLALISLTLSWHSAMAQLPLEIPVVVMPMSASATQTYQDPSAQTVTHDVTNGGNSGVPAFFEPGSSLTNGVQYDVDGGSLAYVDFQYLKVGSFFSLDFEAGAQNSTPSGSYSTQQMASMDGSFSFKIDNSWSATDLDFSYALRAEFETLGIANSSISIDFGPYGRFEAFPSSGSGTGTTFGNVVIPAGASPIIVEVAYTASATDNLPFFNFGNTQEIKVECDINCTNQAPTLTPAIQSVSAGCLFRYSLEGPPNAPFAMLFSPFSGSTPTVFGQLGLAYPFSTSTVVYDGLGSTSEFAPASVIATPLALSPSGTFDAQYIVPVELEGQTYYYQALVYDPAQYPLGLAFSHHLDPSAGSAASRFTIQSPQIEFASDETNWAFLPPFQNNSGSEIAPTSRFRFLADGTRQVKFRLPGVSTAGDVAYLVDAIAGDPFFQPIFGVYGGGSITFTPLASSFAFGWTRPLSAVRNIPIAYSVTVVNMSGDILTCATIYQDIIDCMRQEYLDWSLHPGTYPSPPPGCGNFAPTNWLSGNGAPTSAFIPRSQVGVPVPGTFFTSNELSGPNASLTPNYIDSVSGNAIVWNAGYAQMADQIRAAYGSPCILTSGFRNPSYNLAACGRTNSIHQWGRALDIKPASIPAGAGKVTEFLKLYRAVLPVGTNETILENGPQELLPENWNPPLVNETAAWSVQGGTNGVVTFSDNDGSLDALPEALIVSMGSVPQCGTTTIFNGRTIMFVGPNGESTPAAGNATTWRLVWNGIVVNVKQQFAAASHVHAAQ